MTAAKPADIPARFADLPHCEKRGPLVRAVGRLAAARRRLRGAWDAQGQPELVLPPAGRYPISIGRAPGSVLRISASSVSRFHAQLEATSGGSWTLRDIGSANGTWVNGSRVLTAVPVRPGDVVAFGSVTYRLATSQRRVSQDFPAK